MFVVLGLLVAALLLVRPSVQGLGLGSVVWLFAGATSLVAGLLVQGFTERPDLCDRAEAIYAVRAEPEVMEDLAATYDLRVDWDRGGVPETFTVSDDGDPVASATHAAPLPDSALRCA